MPRIVIWLALVAFAASPVLTGSSPDSQAKEPFQFNSLFGSGGDPLAWDNDELKRIRKLHRKNFNDKAEYLQSRNLAEYLGLSRVDALHLPVPVNVILLGFKGDGHMNVNVTSEELKTWFEHIDHVIPHTRVPLSELSCQEDGSCTRTERVRRPAPLHSYVHFNISAQVVEVAPDVAGKFETAAEAFSRPSFATYPNGPRVVDAANMEQFVNGFLNDLGLLWSYTIIIMNSGKTPRGQSYSYKVGLEKNEIDSLTKDPHLIKRVVSAVKSLPTSPLSPPHWSPFSRGWRPTRPAQKFSVNQMQYESSQWCNQIDDWFIEREKVIEHAKARLGKGNAVVENLLGMQGFHGEADLSSLLESVSANVNRVNESAAGKLRVMEPEEGCGVDTWVGHERWLFLDLSAMGTDWGPYVGGEGLKTSYSLPLVLRYFQGGPVTRTYDEQGEDHLSSKLDDEIDKMVDKVHKDQKEIDREEASRKAAEGDNVVKKIATEVPEDTWLRAELDVYESFANEHCKGVRNPPQICTELQERVVDLVDEIMDRKITTISTFRQHAWDIFGTKEEKMTEEVASREGRLKDLFLAHLSAVISKAIRHVFLPPSLAWQQQPGASYDMGLHYSKTVTFTIYMISDPSRKTHWWTSQKEFDVEALKSEILGMKLTSQTFKFNVKKMRLLDDPALSGALSMSVRSANRQNLNKNGGLADEVQYFDSNELRSLLRRQIVDPSRGPSQNTEADGFANLHVPVFILTLDRNYPIFIDQHYISKALPDMVVVVDNLGVQGQHPMGITCNGDMVGHTEGSSLKAALSALLQHLGGLLPPHLGYSPAHKAITHDWMWSVGAHPFSMTSPGWKVSQVQHDAHHRRYVLDALDSSIDMVNHGIEILTSEKPSEASYAELLLSHQMASDMLKKFSLLVEMWRRTVTDAGEMEFDRACVKISEIERHAMEFLQLALSIQEKLHPAKCGKSEPFVTLGVTDEVLGGALFLGVALCVYGLILKIKWRKEAQRKMK